MLPTVSGNPKLYGVVPSGIVSPLTKLNEEQKEKIRQLKEIVEGWKLQPAEREFCDDMCIFRYLMRV